MLPNATNKCYEFVLFLSLFLAMTVFDRDPVPVLSEHVYRPWENMRNAPMALQTQLTLS